MPKHLRRSIIEENHQGPLAGHFSGERLYKALARLWWWQDMYGDVVSRCASCPQCAIVNSSGRVNRPHTSPAGVPDRRCGRDGEQACRCLPGFPLQVAIGLPCPGPEGPETGQIAGGRGCTLFRGTRSLAVGQGDKPVIPFDAGRV